MTIRSASLKAPSNLLAGTFQFCVALMGMTALGQQAVVQTGDATGDQCKLASVKTLTLRCMSAGGHLYAVADVDLRSEAIAVTSTVDSKQDTLAAVATTFTRRGGKPLLATNAGIYGSDNRPLGLLIAPDGRLQHVNRNQGRGNLFWDSAIFETFNDQTASIIGAQEWRDGGHIVAATQSGPQLANAGKVNPSLPIQSKSAFRRTAVGIDQANRHIVHIAVSSDAVTLFELATFMVNAVHCSEALHLDGDLSAFFIPSTPNKLIFSDPGERIVTALIVTEKADNSPRAGK